MQGVEIEGIAALETGYAVHAFIMDQSLSLADCVLAKASEQDAVAPIDQVSQRVDYVAAMSGGNIENPQGLVIGPKLATQSCKACSM